MKPLLIIGGSNIDYIGHLNHQMILKDSNVGTLAMSFGGVGRNITENLARLGLPITFATAIGSDPTSLKMKEILTNLGVKLVLKETMLPSASYVAFINPEHDMEVALCDSRITEEMDEAFIDSIGDLIQKHQMIVIDGNLSQSTIDYFFHKVKGHEIFVDAISTAKAMKFRHHLSEITLFKANIYEARAILHQETDAKALLKEFLAKGLQNVIITQGLDPIVYAYHGKCYESPVKPADHVVNATGAGDAFLSGIIACLLRGETNHQAMIEYAKKMSYWTLQAEEAVNPNIASLMEEEQ